MAKTFNLNLVTGHAGYPHVSASDARDFNAGLFGTSDCVFKNLYGWDYEIVSTNRFMTYGGGAIVNGAHVSTNGSVTIDLDAGASGYKRNDLVGILIHANDEVETAVFTSYKGTPTTGTPVDPTNYPQEDILMGGQDRFYPIFRVVWNGLSISKVDKLYIIAPNILAIDSRLSTAETKLDSIGTYKMRTNFDTSSCANGWTTVGTLTVPAGQIWEVNYSINFQSNTTGNRRISITKSNTAEYSDRNYRQSANAVSGQTTDLCMTALLDAGTWYFNCGQSSGATLNIYASYSYVRLH